jgi:hypothetical protein
VDRRRPGYAPPHKTLRAIEREVFRLAGSQTDLPGARGVGA